MKQSHKVAVGVVTALGLGIATSAIAHPGQMGEGMGPHMMSGMHQGARAGMQHGMQHGAGGGMGPGAMKGGPAGAGAGQQLVTPEERTAFIEKMRNAKTPAERQQIAAANHAEMQKRAQEKGITLPEGRGPRFGATPQAPATTEHAH